MFTGVVPFLAKKKRNIDIKPKYIHALRSFSGQIHALEIRSHVLHELPRQHIDNDDETTQNGTSDNNYGLL